MKKSLSLEISPGRYPLRQASCCSPDSPCVRCSMIRLTSHRFAIFRKKFGRLPKVNDELFFDETRTRPIRASESEIRNQIFAAAGSRTELFNNNELPGIELGCRRGETALMRIRSRIGSPSSGAKEMKDMRARVCQSRHRAIAPQAAGDRRSGRGAGVTRGPAGPNRGRRLLHSSLAETNRRPATGRGWEPLLASAAGCLEFSRKVSTSSRRKRFIRPIA
jgi:hypothetical protein